MSDLLDLEVLKERLKAMRGKDTLKVPFAFVEAAKADYLMVDPKRTMQPMRLHDELKTASKGTAGTYGTAWMVGERTLVLQQDKNYSGLERKLPALLRPLGYKLMIADKDGKIQVDAGNVAFTQVRLAWGKTREDLRSQLERLEQAILAKCKNAPNYDEIKKGISDNLFGILEDLDESLLEALDRGLSAATPDARAAVKKEALAIVNEYREIVKSDELLQVIDDNGFVDLTLLTMLSGQLDSMATSLAA